MVEQAIEHRRDRGGVAEQPPPIVDGPVRGEECARALVAAHDQLEQILGRGGGELAHAEVVEDEQGHAGHLGEIVLARAVDRLVDAMNGANEDCNVLATAIVTFMSQVGIGFTASSFGDVFQQELRDGCAARRRGKPAKIQELSRLLLAEPDHRGVAAVLRRLTEFKRTEDGDFASVKLDCNKEFWDAINLGEFATVEDGLAEITHRRNYARPRPPEKAISIVHKAKGLECDATILMPCDSSTFPDNTTARCLIYVAISRAKHRLMIVISREHPSPLLRI